MAPTTTQASATLNTGHHWKSMKSTTRALQEAVVAAEGPVDEVAERATQDQARRATGAEAGAQRAARPASTTTTTTASRAMAGPARAADSRLKAAPVLRARLKLQRPHDVDGAGLRGRAAAHHLVSWSTMTTAAATPRIEPRDGEVGPTSRRGCGSPERRATRSASAEAPDLYSTRSRAHGMALRRSSGIGWPETSQMP